jgi:hypothetical protein
MPRNVMDKVWAYFDTVGPLTGVAWPITYREHEEQRLARLRAMGVRAFPSLVYPPQAGMAEWLNTWATGFAREHEDVVHTATFFPEPGVTGYVSGARGRRATVQGHLQVAPSTLGDPLLDDVWGRLAERGVPIVVHCGGGPIPGPFTGPGPMGEVLARHPDLVAVVAHMGMPEYAEFLALARRYPRVHLDTTMLSPTSWRRTGRSPPRSGRSCSTCRSGSCWAATSPTRPTRTRTSSRPWPGSSWVIPGCGPSLHDNGARLLQV